MGNRDDDKARAELQFALDALEDGFGHEQWGPGPVLRRLSKRNLDAAEAFGYATMATHDLLKRSERADFIRAMRKLAPVFLELVLERAPVLVYGYSADGRIQYIPVKG